MSQSRRPTPSNGNYKSMWFVYAFCSLFVVVGAGMFYVSVANLWKMNQVVNWPNADATITACALEDDHDAESTSYEVKVQYDYSVSGKSYTGTKIYPAYRGSSLGGHRALYERLKSCTVVKARYNPVDPSEAYIVIGRFYSDWTMVYGGILFMGFGVLFTLLLHCVFFGSSDYVSGLEVVR